MFPSLEADRKTAAASARTPPRTEVLHPSVNVVGIGHVDTNRFELSERQVVWVVPGVAPGERNGEAIVVAEQHMVAIVRVYPHRLVVAAETDCSTPGLAAVESPLHTRVKHINAMVIIRVDADLPKT